MTTTLHYYGSAFVLSRAVEDEVHRLSITDYFERAKGLDATLVVWFDLEAGGHVSFPITKNTPLAIQTS